MGILDFLDGGSGLFGRSQLQQKLPKRAPIIHSEGEDSRVVLYDDPSFNAMAARKNAMAVYGSGSVSNTYGRRAVIEVRDAEGNYAPVNQVNPFAPAETQIAALSAYRETGQLVGAGSDGAAAINSNNVQESPYGFESGETLDLMNRAATIESTSLSEPMQSSIQAPDLGAQTADLSGSIDTVTPVPDSSPMQTGVSSHRGLGIPAELGQGLSPGSTAGYGGYSDYGTDYGAGDYQPNRASDPHPNPNLSNYYDAAAPQDNPYAAPDKNNTPVQSALLNVLSSESNGNWNAWFGNSGNTEDLGQLSLREIRRRQARPGNDAAGFLQIVPSTLDGMVKRYGYTGDTRFDKNTQTEMALLLMQEKGLSGWLNGSISDGRFANNIAGTWAGIKQSNGRGRYDGDGVNKGTDSHGSVIKKLRTLKKAILADPQISQAALAGKAKAGSFMQRKQDVAKSSPMQVGELTQRKNQASKVQTTTTAPAPANPIVDDTTKKSKRLKPIEGLIDDRPRTHHPSVSTQPVNNNYFGYDWT